MGNHQLIAVILRLFAIALVIYVLRNIPNIAAVLQEPQVKYASIYFYVTISGILLFALLIWLFPKIITKNIIPNEITIEDTKTEKDSFLAMGLIILGIYLIYYALGDLIYWGFAVISGITLGTEQKVYLFITVIEFMFALFLIFGFRGIANIIIRIRGR